MKQVFEAAADITRFLDAQGWSYCIIDGLAVVRWGRARATAEVDVTLLTGFGNEASFIETLGRDCALRRPDGLQYALTSRRHTRLGSCCHRTDAFVRVIGIPRASQSASPAP